MEVPTPDTQEWDLQFPETDELQKLLHRAGSSTPLTLMDDAGGHADTGLELLQNMCLPPVNEAQESGSPGQDKPLHAMEEDGLLSCPDSSPERGPNSILHLAVQSRRPASVTLLLRYGFDIDARNTQGRTPLLIAIENDDHETVKTLLAHGADPNTASQRPNFEEESRRKANKTTHKISKIKMKFTLGILFLALGYAHYVFDSLVLHGQPTTQWGYVRITENHYSNAPVVDVTSPEIRCYQATDDGSSTEIANVTAGDTVGFTSSPAAYHPGPLSFYMAKAPDGVSAAEFNGTGNVWFKISQDKPAITASSITWPNTGEE
ncbi:1-alkyl-2-acetylglycerophosphocholine esterase [Scedosporium apiospermum]|uniref:lytic cellulose monooxygenase (C4-dehydrogenating) n=1 Tax=Pseudallescheria apiosperma TaxID=563466 RepID=A0A084G1V1_PSEDA|nr:1-alkyl-2-acetylglycerophosphocholine esterase [Scedosporium apiospermum]KEZ41313.1 1-alkyl-2-acetylglycerophosphocholine esterase [Scedosporium apiospermum]